MSNTVRLALFGAGGIGARHLQLADEEPECEIVAVADPMDAAVAAAGHHPARHYRDFRELLAREALDGAIVATPNATHAEIGIACAERGLPLLVEKPITDTVASARALLDAVARHAVPLAVGHHRRFDPAIGIAREVIESAGIGRLVAVECLWVLTHS